MKSKLLRTLSVIMSLVLLFNLAISSSAASKSELQDQLADIQAEREEKQELLDSMKGDLDKQEEYVTTLYAQIEAIQVEIDIYQEKINVLNTEVEGINAEIINIHTIKPLDEELIIKAAQETKMIFTVEEHSVIGGLGSAVCDVVCEKNPVPVKKIGMYDCFGESGPAVALLAKYKLDGQGVYEQIAEYLKNK